MAADKGDTGSTQAGDAAKQAKKKAAPKKKTESVADKLVAEAKAAFKDIDLSEGRSLRKRAAPAKGPAKSAPKKTNKKKTSAPKKAKSANDDTKGAKSE